MKQPHPDEATINLFHPLFKQWFFSKFKALSEPQRYSIMNIHSRINTLVSSPTGSGKTLSAFGAILNNLIDLADKNILEDKVYAIYVSPLRALSNDVHQNLIRPLEEINHLAFENGKDDFNIRVAVRTGDTTAKEKREMLKNPPHILITTPESLSILLSSKRFREHLRDVEWCVVDEIHSLASNKRGVHLNLTLELLSHIATHLCRVGLSATVAPLDKVARFLVGAHRPCSMVDVQYLKKIDLEVLTPIPDLIETSWEERQAALYKCIDYHVQQHKTTLIFTNTRAATERMVHHLKEHFADNYSENIGAHHGSLSKEARLDVEERLRKGELKAVVCSTSLELGIDIGYIDLVLCVNSPKSIARALQRIGRSGHALHETTKGKIIVTNRDDLVECCVLVKHALDRNMDKIAIPENCLDVLAQQLVGFVLEQKWMVKELYDIVTKSYCYRDTSYADFLEVIDYLAGEHTILESRYIYPKIWHTDQMIGNKAKMSRVIFMTNIGTIPNSSFVSVKIGQHIIGKIDEGFLEQLKKGDVFVLGGKTYQFKHAKGMVAQVGGAVGKKPTVPQWASEALPLSVDLAQEITRFRGLMKERFALQMDRVDHISFVMDYLYCKKEIAMQVYEYFAEQYKFCKKMSTPTSIVVEHFDDVSDSMVVFHTLYSRKVNQCLAYAVKFAIKKLYKRDVKIGLGDNGFYVLGKKGVNVKRAFEILQSDKFDLVLSHALDNSEVFRRRFRNCAVRALMILTNYKGQRRRAGKQQVSSMILLKTLREHLPQHFILREAYREVTQDLMDVDKTKEILQQLQDEEITLDEFHTKIPSPFAFSLSLQAMMELLTWKERTEYIKYTRQLVLAKISLEEGKKKRS